MVFLLPLEVSLHPACDTTGSRSGKIEMNNPLMKAGLIGLLLMMIISPFAGLAPLMLIVFGFGACWFVWSLVQAFFTPGGIEELDRKSEFESSEGKP